MLFVLISACDSNHLNIFTLDYSRKLVRLVSSVFSENQLKRNLWSFRRNTNCLNKFFFQFKVSYINTMTMRFCLFCQSFKVKYCKYPVPREKNFTREIYTNLRIFCKRCENFAFPMKFYTGSPVLCKATALLSEKNRLQNAREIFFFTG